ncbi:hypothetical protein E2562_019818 [Oryza meyeriana var. granulata]|uniref:Uncharacterized protein n=1 Tax=Oryza meyeriana var. granulata TaxID=110450 RepID=A0A6G1DJN6_9ORYZ|nr:hypothetical protein E2562_019818 [Oryza meyeriana var. granulata]
MYIAQGGKHKEGRDDLRMVKVLRKFESVDLAQIRGKLIGVWGRCAGTEFAGVRDWALQSSAHARLGTWDCEVNDCGSLRDGVAVWAWEGAVGEISSGGSQGDVGSPCHGRERVRSGVSGGPAATALVVAGVEESWALDL